MNDYSVITLIFPQDLSVPITIAIFSRKYKTSKQLEITYENKTELYLVV